MKFVVITAEKIIEGEPQLLNELFESGMPLLHLRKPGYSVDETGSFIAQISPEYHNRIILHDHFSLLEKFNLRGVHLNRRNPVAPQHPDISISRSCHTLDEIEQFGKEFEYAFLSPVFDSVSKAGYKQAFTAEQLIKAKAADIINEKIIALGGITPENIATVKEYGFGGIAILGYLWGDYARGLDKKMIKEKYKQLQLICNSIK